MLWDEEEDRGRGFSPSSDHRTCHWRSWGKAVWLRLGGSPRWVSDCGSHPASSVGAACECGSGPPQWLRLPGTTTEYRETFLCNFKNFKLNFFAEICLYRNFWHYYPNWEYRVVLLWCCQTLHKNISWHFVCKLYCDQCVTPNHFYFPSTNHIFFTLDLALSVSFRPMNCSLPLVSLFRN